MSGRKDTLMAEPIDWFILNNAVQFYQNMGDYTYVETPWVVPHAALMLTCPSPDWIIDTNGHGGLVASAEQGFLALEQAGRIGKGRFLSCGPCYREERVYDDLHQFQFMKVELYRNDQTDEAALDEMVTLAQKFFAFGLPVSQPILREPTPEGFDLTLNGVEIGSYGIREAGGFRWVYGTGVALPRFSVAKRKAVPAED